MNEWTVIMLLEGGGGADVTLYSAHVKGETIEQAIWAAWEPLKEEAPAVIDMLVQDGHNVDMGGERARIMRVILNLES